MRAMVCHALGGPANLVYEEVDGPHASAGQVLIDVRAAGVNFPDGLMVAGTYQTKAELPFTPGSEVAGVVREIGSNVTGFVVGQRVSAFCGTGGYAGQVVVGSGKVYPVPATVDFAVAATFPIVYGTSYHALVNRAKLNAGEILLVLGASGGVGLTAVQLGRALGARVIAAASTDEKLALCAAHGADELINYTTTDLRARVQELTGGSGVDVVYDPVGGEAAATALRCLGWQGRYLTVGYASGDIPRVGMNRLLLNEGALLGVFWGSWATRNPEPSRDDMALLWQWWEDGTLRPHLSATFLLNEASIALATVMERRALGKIALVMPGDAAAVSS